MHLRTSHLAALLAALTVGVSGCATAPQAETKADRKSVV
jgi:type IV pilus biogenesis protein CpaD/CtpE